MPTYEYSCPHCETVFELWQNVGDAPPPCPECAAVDVKKVFHPPRVHFKGSGFYLTDLRAEKEQAKSGSSSAKKDGESAAPAETKAESKTDATPAPAKSDTSPAKENGAKAPSPVASK